jgi:hypothetical protein
MKCPTVDLYEFELKPCGEDIKIYHYMDANDIVITANGYRIKRKYGKFKREVKRSRCLPI